MAILFVAEHDNGSLSEKTAKALSAALRIGAEVDILVAGQAAQAAANAAARLMGTRKVLLAEADELAEQLPEPMAALIVSLADRYDTFMAPATSTGKNIMPRVAALLDVMQISEIIEVVAADTFKRPIYAGNAIQVVRTSDSQKVITVRTASFPAAPGGGSASVEAVTVPTLPALSGFVESRLSEDGRPDLTAARIVVSGGRGLGSKEQFESIIFPLADKLNAAVGASRAAVDAGFVPNDCQVGQTGKIIAPELYIACGISGAIQHLAGIKDSKIIVAINSDPDAPIFSIADYGLVADIFDAVSEFTEQL